MPPELLALKTSILCSVNFTLTQKEAVFKKFKGKDA